MNNTQCILDALKIATDTKAFELGEGVLHRAPALFKEYFPNRKAVIVADNNTWKAAGEAVDASMREAGIPCERFLIEEEEFHADWPYVERIDEMLDRTGAVAVAVGSGVINDLCKLASFHHGQSYLCVATAASVDGYSSSGAVVSRDGAKLNIETHAPLVILADVGVLAAAPKEMTAAGYADLAAKIPAGAEWMIADLFGTEPIIPAAWNVFMNDLDAMLADPEGVAAGKPEAIASLFAGLTLSGIAMQVAKSSRPASGMEHQFSHFWDMEDLEFEGKHVSHGFKVGIGTLASTAFLEMLLDAPVEQLDIERCVAAWKSWDETERDIRAIFNDDPEFVARGLKETRDKYVDREGLRDQLTRLKKAWPELRERIRRQIIPFDEVRRRLELVGAPYEPEQIGVSRTRFREAFGKIPYMRSRYTVIDTAFRCGWMEEWLDRLFGKGGVWEVGSPAPGSGEPARSAAAPVPGA